MGSVSWLKELPEDAYILDHEHRHVVIDWAVFLSINEYATSVPTSPSPGRVYRRSDLRTRLDDGRQVYVPSRAELAQRHWLYVVERDPNDEKFCLHHPYQAFPIDANARELAGR